jgi:hypothetical protein
MPPQAGASTRVGNPASPMASTMSGVRGWDFMSAKMRELSEGLRAVVTILYPSAGMRNMRRNTTSGDGVPS